MGDKNKQLSQFVALLVGRGVESGSAFIIEQGMELLTGIPVGELDDEGNYPEGSINQRVVSRLETLTEIQRAFREPSEDELESEDEPQGAIASNP